MPIFDTQCVTCGSVREVFVHLRSQHDPPCAECGSPTRRLMSSFAVAFSGEISGRYLDRKSEPLRKIQGEAEGAHWVYERRSSPDGKPRPRLITSFAEQADYCKREGLVNPRDADRDPPKPRDQPGV